MKTRKLGNTFANETKVEVSAIGTRDGKDIKKLGSIPSNVNK